MSTLALRAEAPEDDAFLFALFADDALPMLTRAGLDVAAATAMVRMQYRARAAAHRDGGARCRIATLGGTPVGWLVARRTTDGLHLVDLAVPAAHRRRGHATAILAYLIGEARAAGLPVTLNVAAENAPALVLYRRHGFAPVSEAPPYLAMRLEP